MKLLHKYIYVCVCVCVCTYYLYLLQRTRGRNELSFVGCYVKVMSENPHKIHTVISNTFKENKILFAV
jgi:hypothetical protein